MDAAPFPAAAVTTASASGQRHAPGRKIAATIWRQPQLLSALSCICGSATAAGISVSAGQKLVARNGKRIKRN
ncbi:hypothetical protein OJAV_G00049770 [Oryzias javanicus]|uniref:Uncharacterized protein n=1 Tax=Oryzias javanicus TaxID=123683 RepID=A0A437DF60_ORYJA|nr:hypothetical protein OJAV_G00049770 [Oryzias javanicus]